ncbi:LPS export ABC transporter permease LptF [Serratia rhizosphaerae]|uniref:LPS export ABC transporter permease LptF n=1 Tax=unclassified Serratia (in: enterobacteria) TaxID=2647522 RepID=UPI000CF6BF82|nr:MULTISPECIES: LPS export ABC transporter permease LptF [unclassified Serratia (in: enterobacteria)]MBU3894572.1 LPS export ABC transporter permease LptF [Serratia rubidaea]AVJ16057.1 lipopolysaccharide ABC transporter permease LptF [Serratia sp. MYb239]MCA4824466.1 LPS export ABC transporter permease LptF [Serratia rubidaea]QNK32037.1 LPS export ABC transporter permease LptF [Serratia sp. JUb9]QPT14060.1 LPS export ABC transporter permease LptF [Serratia rubidaea]
MIIIRYLVRETLKSQIAILFILLLIFFCQNLVRVLGDAVDGDVPTNLVLSLLALSVPKMAQLILPLSLFLGLLMTLGRLYTESEITVMHACGLGKRTLIVAAMVLALFTALAAAANVFWIGPWASSHQDEVVAEAKANPSVAGLAEGQFKPSQDGNAVLFIGNVKGNTFNDVFLAQLRPNGNQRPSVVVAEHGKINQSKDGSQVVTLDKGTRFEGTALLRDFRITDFSDYKAVIGHRAVVADNTEAEQMPMSALWQSDDQDARAEFHWRLTLVVSVVLMALLVVPLSVVNPRQGRVLSMLPAILLYLIFFLLQTSLRSNAGKGKLDPMLWIWLVNAVYLAIALALNLWDTVPMRKLRGRLRGAA